MKDWFTKLTKIQHQMEEQSKAARGRMVEWHFAEKPVADYFRDFAQQGLFSNVIVLYTPPEAP